MRLLFLIFGTLFGYVLIKSGVSNYDVIRDMFLLRSFHLYGVLMIAVGTVFMLNLVLKRVKARALLTGEPIDMSVMKVSRGHLIGGLLGGFGWALTGACPGPALAQIGFGSLAGLFTAAGIFLGTYVYGSIQDRNTSR